jgi:tyrosine phenol-lyase
MKIPLEPFRIKMVEPIHLISRTERERIIADAGYNVFKIPAEKVFIDLLTDSGTSAMSDQQWAGLMTGDESYAGCRNYFHLQKTVQEITGYPFVLPTHQGRAAENILFSTVLKPGCVVPSNIHFDTTRANIEYLGSEALDCVIAEGLDPEIDHPFKGNMDLKKLDNILTTNGRDKIPLVGLTITNNSGGGQPVSMVNIRKIAEICHSHNVMFFFDAARFAENAYFIKQREPEYSDTHIHEIVREMFSYGDGCWVSAKKDALVNIGGFIALRDESLYQKLQNLLILREGFPTYGGLAGRDLEAMAIGLKEVLDENYLAYRFAHTAYLGQLLAETDIPVVKPIGGHAVYIDARKFISHIPQAHFPAQALTVALYREGGIRGVEIGSLMFASQNPDTGDWKYPKLELVRLAIPRRVYTTSHLHYVAEALQAIQKKKSELKGLRMINSPPFLRHFTAVLEEIT